MFAAAAVRTSTHSPERHSSRLPLPPVVGYLKRLGASLGAYQLANILAKVIGVVMLPLYTRYLSPGDYGTIELLANGVILISILVRLGMIEAFLRYYFSDTDAERRDALVRRAVVFLLIIDDDRLDRAVGVRGAAQRDRARPSQPGDLPRRGARAVVVHEPRARLPAAARRRAAAAVRDHFGHQRGADGRRHDHARDRPAQGPRGLPARQLRRDHADPLLAVVQAARAIAVAPGRIHERRAVLGADAVWLADGAGRGVGLPAVDHRPLLPLPPPQPGAGRDLLDRDQARGRGRVHRQCVSVRVAAAGLLGHRRRRGQPPLRTGDDLLPAGLRLRRRRADAARPLGAAAAGGAVVLRRLQGAAVAGARLGALSACGWCS